MVVLQNVDSFVPPIADVQSWQASTEAKVAPGHQQAHPTQLNSYDEFDDVSSSSHQSSHLINRNDFVKTTTGTIMMAVTSTLTKSTAAVAADGDDKPVQVENSGIKMFKTNSGLKYYELQEGIGSTTPQYGQLCSIQYTGYLKLPTDDKPQQFDSKSSFLIKHGNGRMIAGLDEGLHTLKVGGKRRLIIPPKLGYVQSGLGPIPEYPWNRWRLNNLLNQMITQRGGNLVFDIQLLSIIDDEADQGYYQDESPTPEEFEKLKLNFQQSNAAAATARDIMNAAEE